MALVVLVLAAGCGSDDDVVVPIEDIPPKKKATDLSAAEWRGLCKWGHGVVDQKLGGRMLACGGIQLTVQRRCEHRG